MPSFAPRVDRLHDWGPPNEYLPPVESPLDAFAVAARRRVTFVCVPETIGRTWLPSVLSPRATEAFASVSLDDPRGEQRRPDPNPIATRHRLVSMATGGGVAAVRAFGDAPETEAQ
jgi:hypothetical protein